MKDYLTIAEVSAAAGISRQAVYKKIKLNVNQIDNYVIEVDNKKMLKKSVLFDVFGVEECKPVDKSVDKSLHEVEQPLSTEIQGKNDLIDVLREQTKFLQQQIEIKDKQISAYEKQLEDYSKRLKEALELTKGHQLISAIEKADDLLERNTDAADPVVEVMESEPAAAVESVKERKTKKKVRGRLFSWLGK